LQIVLLFSAGKWQQLHPSARAPSFPSLSFDQVPLGQVPGHHLLYPLGEVPGHQLGEVPGHLHSWPPLSLPTIEGLSRCQCCFFCRVADAYSILWIRIQHFKNVLYSDSDHEAMNYHIGIAKNLKIVFIFYNF
jgi:hypothetical protein